MNYGNKNPVTLKKMTITPNNAGKWNGTFRFNVLIPFSKVFDLF